MRTFKRELFLLVFPIIFYGEVTSFCDVNDHKGHWLAVKQKGNGEYV